MSLVVVGLSHHTASLPIRERAILPAAPLVEALGVVQAKAQETVILSTCNRTELYIVAPEGEPAALFEVIFPEEGAGLRPYLFRYEGIHAADHLFRVAAGLDSLLIGESEILGQVCSAWELAHCAGTTGPITSRLFQRALAAGKRVRAETDIGRFPASSASAAVALARGALGRDLSARAILLVGAGEVGQSVARCFLESKAQRLLVANHRSARAQELVDRYGGLPVSWPVSPAVLAQADIVVTCTSAPTTVFGAEEVAEALALRRGRPLCIIDLALPRDVDPDVGNIVGVNLHNLDDLRVVAEQSLEKRQRTIPLVEAVTQAEARKFAAWLQERATFALIRDLRDSAERIGKIEAQWAMAQLGHLTARDQRIVEALAHRLTNKLLHAPTTALRKAAREGLEPERGFVRNLFDLDNTSQGA